MTRMFTHFVAAEVAQPSPTIRPAWRPILLLIAALAAVAGILAAPTLMAERSAAANAADAELTMLLRCMAVIKAAMALAAVALAEWRLRYPATSRLAVSYVIAAALMAAGPGLIWHMATIVEGAAVFHAGLAMLLVLAWLDRGQSQRLFARGRIMSDLR